jgi:hypothetical protein
LTNQINSKKKENSFVSGLDTILKGSNLLIKILPEIKLIIKENENLKKIFLNFQKKI